MKRCALFLPALMLGLVCIAAKLALAWPRIHGWSGLSQLLAISSDDIRFVLFLGIVSSAFLFATRRRPLLHLALIWFLLSLYVLAAVYAVLNVGIYRAMAY